MSWKELAGITVLMLLVLPKKTGNTGLSYLGRIDLPRGLSNNNPGNIRINPNNNWKGKVPEEQNTDGAFEQFRYYVYGVRAMIKLILNYRNMGHNTISSIINRYSPVSDNTAEIVSNYINYVSSFTGIEPESQIQNSDIYSLIEAMARFENGRSSETIPVSIFNEAIEMI